MERLRAEGADACGRILDALRPLRLRLVLNQVRGEADLEVAFLLRSGFDKFFGLELRPVGSVEYDLSSRSRIEFTYLRLDQTDVEALLQAIRSQITVLPGTPPLQLSEITSTRTPGSAARRAR